MHERGRGRLQESHRGIVPVHGEGGRKPREPIEHGQGWYRVVVQARKGPEVKQTENSVETASHRLNLSSRRNVTCRVFEPPGAPDEL